jgi:ParB-like chromosome segregation protein Spo0J/DNA modification methylase
MIKKISEIVLNNNRRKVDELKVKELAESIKQLGLINSITVNSNNVLIAGNHRLEAFKLLGKDEIEVTVLDLNNLLAELAEIDENLVRNELHWTDADKQIARRKIIYLELYPETKAGGDRKSDKIKIQSLDYDNKTFIQDTVDKTNKSKSSISQSVKRGNEITEQEAEVLKTIDAPKSYGDILIKQTTETRAKVINALKVESKPVEIIIQDIKKEQKQQIKTNERERLAEIGKTKKIDIDFRLGDFEEVFKDIPDGSIDCIITDPPYPYEFIEVWSKLSRVAKRVLKPNGYCIAYSGQMYLPEVMQRMSENLDYYWTFAVYHEGQTQIVNGINLMCRWKPVLIFQNGKKKIENTFQDYFISEQREKNGHDWQQSKSGVGYLIEMFTKEGDTILEPFAGSGTTIIAARDKKRNVIASEIDEKTYNIAKALI